MTTADQNFSRPGAVDLSGLTAQASAQAPSRSGGGYVVEVTEAGFEQLAQQSMLYPVVLLLVSGRDASGQQLTTDLSELVNAQQGRLQLGIVDVDTQPRIAQALRVSAVPTALALIAGQLVPLFQGTRDKADVSAVVDQIVEIAVANGLTGRAQPQPAPARAASADADAAEAPDPRFAAADDALGRGDYQAAVAEFDKLLASNPRDAEALAGRAQAALLARTADADESVLRTAQASPDDIDAQLAAADFELLMGRADDAFDRLVGVVRRTTDDDRERVRVRLVELFETLAPTDPAVKKGRRALSMALF
ncbi:tetratricopeptide repeat protein [Brooklawnia cerclae]|uniref:Thioredoxin n=1 Tax=Brooklawnia cerclae TaxID=349934 RepID=A0ABX0SDM3_9ACTN|nr:tetratricopeptide repeat protein [Brooklawnia cerclae]NIH56454.1 putative thioredoxin [Brooklawnia cerclae]